MKNLISIEDLSTDEVQGILARAKENLAINRGVNKSQKILTGLSEQYTIKHKPLILKERCLIFSLTPKIKSELPTTYISET